MDEKEKIEKAIKQASASIWLDSLPLSNEYVNAYRINRLKKLSNNKSLTLKRTVNSDHHRRK